MKIIIYAHGA